MHTDDARLPIEPPAGYQQRKSFWRKLLFDASLDQQLVERIWDSPAHVVTDGVLLQTKERCQVTRIPFRDRELLFKHHNWGGTWKALGKARVVPKARRAFLQALMLQQAGIRTPRPLALVESTFGRVGITSSLLTEYVPGTPLYHLIRAGRLTAERIEHLTDQIADLCERLAARCCAHNDLKPENLIVDEHDQIWLIDLENTRTYPDQGTLSYWFNKDLDRLLRRRTWRFHPHAESRLRKKLGQAASVAGTWSHQRPLANLQSPTTSATQEEPILAAVILCEHAEAELAACVASVRDVADEVVLVAMNDSELPPELSGDDGLMAIDARGLSLRVAYAKAVEQVRSPWILALRECDLVSPDLALEMQILLESEPSLSGFSVRCRRMLAHQVVRFGTNRNIRPIRLFRRDAGLLAEHHGQLTADVTGVPGRLNSKIMVSEGDTFRECRQRVARRAAAMPNRQEAPVASPSGNIALQTSKAFLNDYVLNLGLLDGRLGLKSSLLRALETYLQIDAARKHIATPELLAVPQAEQGASPSASRQAA